MSIFDLPTSAIDYTVLDAFLTQRLPEGLNIEYKGARTERIFEGIAAMANTYGGLVFIGVEEDRGLPIVPPVGVPLGEQDRLVNQAYTFLQPPFPLDIATVPLPDSENVVLVIRVDPALVQRPIVLSQKDNHKVLFRIGGRNAPADRYRMASLFAESTGAAALGRHRIGDAMHPASGQSPPLDKDDTQSLIIRVVVEAELPYDRVGRAVINNATSQSLAETLESSSLDRWLRENIGDIGLESWGSSMWQPHGRRFSSQTVLRSRYSAETHQELPFGGQASLMLPINPQAVAGRLTLILDATCDLGSPTANRDGSVRKWPPRLFTLESMNWLLLALLETALDQVPLAVFPSVLGLSDWERIGPVCYFHTAGQTGIGRFINVKRYEWSGAALGLPGETLPVPRGANLEKPKERAMVVRDWLERTLLDMNLRGFEKDLENLEYRR